MIWLILIPLIVWNIRPILGITGSFVKFWLKALLIYGVIMIVLALILTAKGVI